MTEQELIERLADAEHASWSRWMDYLFSRCGDVIGGLNGGALIIPADSVHHWRRQAATPYADLTEREKESDRREVSCILPAIREYTESELSALRERVAALEGVVGVAEEAIEAVVTGRDDVCDCEDCEECGKPPAECTGTDCASTCSCRTCDWCLCRGALEATRAILATPQDAPAAPK